jgi:single-stranded-DNA-specific exonuclease
MAQQDYNGPMTQWLDPQPVRVPQGLYSLVDRGGALDTLVAELLVRRGITRPDVARGFLDPAAYAPAPAGALPDVGPTVERLARAIEQGEPIAVWGDFGRL